MGKGEGDRLQEENEKEREEKSAKKPSERTRRLTNQLRFVGSLGNLKFKSVTQHVQN